jgi:TrmH family RNA methyltransferase
MVGSAAIRSRSNPLVRRLRALKQRGAEVDLCLLEGPTLVEEALSAGVALEEVAVSPRLAESARGRRLVGRLRGAGSPVREVDETVLASLSELETSPGMLALARRPTFDEERLYDGTPLIAVAAGIQNPGNLGGLLRTAEAAGASGAYVTDGSADPLSWKSLRGSMGSALRLPHVRARPREVLQRLRDRGVRRIATTVDPGATPYDHADLRGPVAFLFGPEGGGLPEDLRAAADLRLRIPMRPPVESLNVGVAAGILLYEAARQRRLSR